MTIKPIEFTMRVEIAPENDTAVYMIVPGGALIEIATLIGAAFGGLVHAQAMLIDQAVAIQPRCRQSIDDEVLQAIAVSKHRTIAALAKRMPLD